MHFVIDPVSFVNHTIMSSECAATILLAVLPVSVVVAAIRFLVEATASALRTDLAHEDRSSDENHRWEAFLRLSYELTHLSWQSDLIDILTRRDLTITWADCGACSG